MSDHRRAAAPASSPEDVHEWISFTDRDEDRTWCFDLTFLTSNWTCIYGSGCLGVLDAPAADLEQGCCSYGAHFVDDDDRQRVEQVATRLSAEQWQFREVAQRGGATRKARNGELTTRLVDDACIFLNRPGFPGGAGCALHRGALEAGESYLPWKPEVCWQLPLRRHDVVDEQGHVTSTIREWKRRDWGEGGSDFHWWCTEGPEAFVGSVPVYVGLREELIEMTTPEAYATAVSLIEARQDRVPEPGSVFLPHPARRRPSTDPQGAPHPADS